MISREEMEKDQEWLQSIIDKYGIRDEDVRYEGSHSLLGPSGPNVTRGLRRSEIEAKRKAELEARRKAGLELS